MTEQDRNWMNGRFDSLKEELTLVRIEIAKLKIKSSVWGLMGGLIPVLITISLYLVLKG